jgi:PIN domain nuclease of toxin-antitoxin system
LTLLDTYAVIAFLRGEAAAVEVGRILQHDDARLTSVGLAEVVDHLVRVAGADVEEVGLDLAELGLLAASPVDPAVGLASGRLRARHYHRTRCAISMADAVAAETARLLDVALATSDPHLLDVCHHEEIDVVVLPASDGSRWTARP